MNLYAQRPWITPVVIGAFTLSAVTGVLMFFHLDSGLNKTAHEWLSWAMVIGVVLLALTFSPCAVSTTQRSRASSKRAPTTRVSKSNDGLNSKRSATCSR